MSGKVQPAWPRTLLRWLKTAVLAASILCFGWVLWPIWKSSRELVATVDGAALAGWTAVATAGYALLAALLAAAWWWVAGVYGPRPPARTGYSVWARSQIAKYLPGNAFHFVSRQVMGREAGLSHPALVASIFLENGSLLVAAVLLGAVGLLEARTSASAEKLLPWVLFCGVGCLLFWPAVDSVLRRLPRTRSWIEGMPHLGVVRTLRLLGPALVCHALFFVGTGTLLVLLSASAWGRPAAELWSLVWLYPIAWAAGTIAVGAPAGVGVREAVLVLQLEPLVGPARAAALAVALRLVTTGGDLLTALAGWWLRGDPPHAPLTHGSPPTGSSAGGPLPGPPA